MNYVKRLELELTGCPAHGHTQGMPRDTKPPQTELDQIARRLELARRAMDEMRPADLCRRTGIRPNTYSQWEGAKSRPRLDEARLLCRHFGYTLDWIYEGKSSGLPHKLATRIAELEADSDPEPPHEAAQFGKPRGRPKHAKN